MGFSAAYVSNGVPQADWIDHRGNVVHQWWDGRGGKWVTQLVAGPDAQTEVKAPASASWGVTWILGAFDMANRVDVWTVSEDQTSAIHAWAKAGDAWHAETFPSPSRR